jgi:hypothetical protein
LGVLHTPYIGEYGALQMGECDSPVQAANGIRCNRTIWGDRSDWGDRFI